MNLWQRFWHRVSGNALREAQEELHSSSQWSKAEMDKLLERARLVTKAEVEGLRRFESMLKDLDGTDDDGPDHRRK